MYRILFLGQKWVGEKCFRELLGQPQLQVCGVVSNSSTDVWWGSNTIYLEAQECRLPFIDNSHRNTERIAQIIWDQRIDTILSVQHPWILPPSVLESVRFHAFNIHNAPLPRYKGHNACNHAILNGETRFCSTVHWMVADVDAGAIAFEEWYDITAEDHARSMYDKGIQAGLKAFKRLIYALHNRETIPLNSMKGENTFYPRQSLDSLREVPPHLPAEKLHCLARALFFPPFEPAYMLSENKTKTYLLPQNFQQYLQPGKTHAPLHA